MTSPSRISVSSDVRMPAESRIVHSRLFLHIRERCLFTYRHSYCVYVYITGVLFVTRLSCAAMQEIEDGFDMKQHVESVLQETGMAGLRPRNMSVDDLLT